MNGDQSSAVGDQEDTSVVEVQPQTERSKERDPNESQETGSGQGHQENLEYLDNQPNNNSDGKTAAHSHSLTSIEIWVALSSL